MATTALVALLVAGCTELKSNVAGDWHPTSDTEEQAGVVYLMPERTFTLEISQTLKKCEAFKDPKGDDTFLKVETANKVSMTERLRGDPKNAFVLDYADLRHFTKTTALKIDLYPNGTLKSVNASLKDETGKIVKDTITGALKIAAAIGGVPTGFQKMQLAAQQPEETDKRTEPPLCDLRAAAAIETIKTKKKELAAAKKSLAQRIAEIKACAALAKKGDAACKVSRTIEKDGKTETTQVTRTITDLQAEKKDFERQIKVLTGEIAKLDAVLTYKATREWVPGDPAPGNSHLPVADHLDFYPPDEVLNRWLTRAGREILVAQESAAGYQSYDADADPKPWLFNVHVMAYRHGSSPPLPRSTPQASGELKGVVYRQPVDAQAMACVESCLIKGGVPLAREKREALQETHVIKQDARLVTKATTLPQFGIWSTLPLSNDAFQSNSVNATFAADGALLTFGFGDAAAGAAASSAFAGTADSLAGFLEAREEAEESERVDELEQLKKELELEIEVRELQDKLDALEAGGDANES